MTTQRERRDAHRADWRAQTTGWQTSTRGRALTSQDGIDRAAKAAEWAAALSAALIARRRTQRERAVARILDRWRDA